jgi:hypothetical protein
MQLFFILQVMYFEGKNILVDFKKLIWSPCLSRFSKWYLFFKNIIIIIIIDTGMIWVGSWISGFDWEYQVHVAGPKDIHKEST